MSPLAEREKKLLLRVARQSLIAAVEHRDCTVSLPERESLQRPGGAFVTLFRERRLRGCIGQLPSEIPLIEVVAYCARAAAREDPRFSPVLPEELRGIAIELSVLSQPADISPADIQPGVHGLLVTSGGHRGVLLPQVAVQFHWSAARFLEATCEKAGLSGDAWKEPGTRVQAFTAEVFDEETITAAGGGYSSST